MFFTSYHMYIIAKYFNSIEDYINLLKTCKEYKNVVDLIKYRKAKPDLVAYALQSYRYYRF